MPEPDVELARRALQRARGMSAGADPVTPRTSGGAPRRPMTSPAAAPKTRDPALVGSVLTGIVQRSGWKTSLSVGALLGRWPEIVGPQISDHCTPEAFEQPVLVLRASSTAWAQELRLLSPQILQRMTAELGPGVVEEIQVRAPAAPSWRRGRLRTSGMRGPRDTYG